MIALFALQTADRPLWQLILPLFLLGMFMSTQFTAMNTITLGDLDDHNASSGNSVLAVTQQLSISFGVAVSAAVLRFYDTQVSGSLVDHFHYTFITMGGVTLLSAGSSCYSVVPMAIISSRGVVSCRKRASLLNTDKYRQSRVRPVEASEPRFVAPS